MTLRRRRLLLVALVGLALAIGLCLMFGRPLYATQAQIDRIQPGMPLVEVEAMLGKPWSIAPSPQQLYVWETWTGWVLVFTTGDKVDYVQLRPVSDNGQLQTLWSNRIRRKLGW